MKSSTAITPSATGADVVTLKLTLSGAQYARLTTIAKMANATPEQIAVANIFSELDGWSRWDEFTESIEETLSIYTEEPVCASSCEIGKRLEDDAPERIKKMAGYRVIQSRDQETRIAEYGESLIMEISGDLNAEIRAAAERTGDTPEELMRALLRTIPEKLTQRGPTMLAREEEPAHA